MRDIVRLTKVTLRNVKNVFAGTIELENGHKAWEPSLLGLYGQNGSGKTSLIESLQLLKLVMSGESVPSKFEHLITVGEQRAFFEFQFALLDENEGSFDVYYDFCLERGRVKQASESSVMLDVLASVDDDPSLYVTDEKLSVRTQTARKQEFFNTGSNHEPFTPLARLRALTKDNRSLVGQLTVAKQLARQTSKSLLFSQQFLKSLIEAEADQTSGFEILQRLKIFALVELFVFTNEDYGSIGMGSLPILYREIENQNGFYGTLRFSLTEPNEVSPEVVQVAQKIFEHMNTVLTVLVPGLTVKIVSGGRKFLADGRMGELIELVSVRDGREVALRYESDGIKRIVSILHLLICTYNNPSITVAIDELDSGIFEYLLGELLKIFSRHAYGQLIFTSHNLRPLETIGPRFVAFTTVDPHNRYVRMPGIKSTNNLRTVYFRNIVLGLGEKPLYQETDNILIAMALRKAGRVSDEQR